VRKGACAFCEQRKFFGAAPATEPSQAFNFLRNHIDRLSGCFARISLYFPVMLSALTIALVLGSASDGGSTRAVMSEMFDALMTLQPLTTPAALRSPKTADIVRKQLATLSSLRHAFPPSSTAQEPATAALSSLFTTYALETKRRFEAGETEVVGLRVKTFTSLCFACHSREYTTGDFADVRKRIEGLGLERIDLAQTLAATRQFDAALAIYEKVLADKVTDERSLMEYSRALQDTMALFIRVKDDGKALVRLLSSVAARPELPPFLKHAVTAWQRDALAWEAERFSAARSTPDQLFKRARELVSKTNRMGVMLPDERSDVPFLRASAYLNLALGKSPRMSTRGEALYLLGVCAGALKSPLLWELDLLFFEACVRENPRTPLAKRCYRQLSDRIYFGFTGSAGTNIPDDDLARLSELGRLADGAGTESGKASSTAPEE
jgi:tetratricopeptide (TPR) repeat protein